MQIAILTFDDFNELDSFIVFGRLGALGRRAEITSPTGHVTSMNGVTVQARR